MTNTISVSIDTVYYGYEYKDSPTYTKVAGFFIRPQLNGHYTYVWRESYEDLRECVRKFYGIELPKESELRFKNFGAPYNVAQV